MSSERQKRALSARLHDLEVLVTSFEAEKEQYELENRSLINKLKASNVVDGDFEALKNENIRLQRELSDVKLKSQHQLENDQINNLTSQISKLNDENDSLKKLIEQLKVKEELSDAMEARGYIPGKERTKLEVLKYKLSDYLVYIFVLLFLYFRYYVIAHIV